MNLRQIEVFRAVMSTGSFTKAAELLHVSQPGISRLIRHLELQLGVSLFERNHGRVTATPEAFALHVEVERAYRGVKAVQDFANELRQGANTVLRILASPNVALELLPKAVIELSARYPTARLSFDVQQRAMQMTELLVTEQADIGISALELVHPLLDCQPLGQWTLVCVMLADHPLAAKSIVLASDVVNHPLIAFHKDTLQGRAVEAWFTKRPMPRQVAVEVRSGHVACALVASGGGVAFVDNLTAKAFQSQGLVYRPVRGSQRFTVYAVLNRNRPPPMLAKQLCELVKKRLHSDAL